MWCLGMASPARFTFSLFTVSYESRQGFRHRFCCRRLSRSSCDLLDSADWSGLVLPTIPMSCAFPSPRKDMKTSWVSRQPQRNLDLLGA